MRDQLGDLVVFRALWHWRNGREVSPVDQLAAWQTAADAAILADLWMIAHTSTGQQHREIGESAVWLRFDEGGLVLDILEDGRAVRTLDQATLLETVRGLLDADDPPALPTLPQPGDTAPRQDAATHAPSRPVYATPAQSHAPAPQSRPVTCRSRRLRPSSPPPVSDQLSLF